MTADLLYEGFEPLSSLDHSKDERDAHRIAWLEGELRRFHDLIDTGQTKDALVALTEMRGWASAAPRRERDWMLPRIDICIGVFKVADIIRSIHHDVLEGVEPNG